MEGQLRGLDISRYIYAGNAVFTILNPNTGGRFTYKLRAPRGELEAPIRFVSVLRGSDNSRDYGYIGFIRDGRFVYGRAKATVNPEAPSVRAFNWFFNNMLSDKVEVYHEGKCGKCGKKLTTPESVSRGLGPYCFGMI